MPLYDLIVRHGTVVSEAGLAHADLAVADGRVVALGPQLAGAARDEIDATSLYLFPGVIDAHVHCNEPGRTSWEGFATATAALAAGGATTFFDMPLNAHPPTTDVASFERKLAAAHHAAVVDFALWGGLVPGNRGELAPLAERGVIGFKAFMSNSGIDDFAAVDDLTLYEGMAEAARLGRIVAVHAESDSITGALAQRAREEGRTSVRAYLESRPIIAELEAIARAITFAEATGCALHIVHVSSGRGVALVADARRRGVDVSCETCPHYLALTEDDVETLGALAKCAPPLRSPHEVEALWAHLRDGTLPMVASDHSPAPPEMKGLANADDPTAAHTDGDFFKVWGGISGCQSTLAVLLTEGYERRAILLEAIAAATAGFVARRFNIDGRKGQLAVGCDADFALVDLAVRAPLHATDLLYRHRHSPYVGRSWRGRVVRTVVRGTTVWRDGTIVGTARGQFVRPNESL